MGDGSISLNIVQKQYISYKTQYENNGNLSKLKFLNGNKNYFSWDNNKVQTIK